MFPVGCDSDVVHLPDYLKIEGRLQDSYTVIQDFWNRFISERRFEGLVIHTNDGEEYKIKFRDSLDVAIIAFRMTGSDRPVCEKCGARFDAFWLRKLARGGVIERSEWFDPKGRLLLSGKADAWGKNMETCPLCGGTVSSTEGPILGAKIALMTADGHFVDVADGVQFSPISPVLDLIEPLYEAGGYLWIKPEVVVEVSYQGDQLYVDRSRPVYRFEADRYTKVGAIGAISLRPYRPRLREDKTVNPKDLRLEQLSYFVDRVKSIQTRWRKETQQEDLLGYLSR